MGAICQVRPAIIRAAAFAAMLGPLSAAGGTIDEIYGDGFEGFGPALCDDGLNSQPSDPIGYAKALGLCSGVAGVTLTRADGTGTPSVTAYAVRDVFGPNNLVLAGSAMVVLSTGSAAAIGQANPSYVPPQPGHDAGIQSGVPADWLAANGGTPPSAPGCPTVDSPATAHDPVMLTIDVRVPGNAHSLSFAAHFFTADYAEFVCGPLNDVFVVLLDSAYAGTPANPPDGNLAIYYPPVGDPYPLGVNLARDTGLFTDCLNGATGCQSGHPGVTDSCISPAALAGTGMDEADPNQCESDSLVGGGTGWLLVQGNVVPGETIRLRLALWDSGDGLYDSTVLLDDFRWSPDNVTPGTTLRPL